MLQDGPKKSGRFIKKGDKVLQHILLQDYSLEEISESHIVGFDNASSTIVHAKLHDPQALQTAVRPPPQFDSPLIDSANSRSVIQPRDFTADWRASRSKSGNRRKDNDDEDDELLSSTTSATFETASPTEDQKPVSDVTHDSGRSGSQAQVHPAAPVPFRFERLDAAPLQSDSLEQLRPNAPTFDQHDIVKAAAAMAHHSGPAVDLPSSSQRTGNIPDVTDSFIAIDHKSSSPEESAAEEYRTRAAIQEANEKVLNALKEEARSVGYREGFKLGEEKAELQSRSSAQSLFGHVSELINEFEGLKHTVLAGAQQNFYELAQAMGESLLGREFSIRPESFAAVIRKAIDETVESDSFKIRVNPETYDRLNALDVPDLKKRLVKDSTVGVDHFRIESHLTVVDQNARKLIANLLDKADVDLFVGSDTKVG